MHPAGEIKNIYAEFDPGSINQHSFIGPHDSFSVWIDASPEQGSNHSFFRWRTKGTYEVRTFPELHEKPIPNTNPPIYIPDPLPCSGFYYDTIVQQVIRTGECECCNCWIDEYSQGTLVSDEKFVVNNEFNRVFVARIPADVERFYRKYYIQVEQLSISEDVHNFWQLVRSQQADRGVFQPNVSAVRGNIYNTDDSTDAVLGIFDTSTNACYKTYVGSTNIPPPFW
jgi:hypothetical protein